MTHQPDHEWAGICLAPDCTFGHDVLSPDERARLAAAWGSEATAAAEQRLRPALTELVAAFTAKPDTDEMDHPGGLTTAQVELAWAQWDLRQQKALEAAQALLDSAAPSTNPKPISSQLAPASPRQGEPVDGVREARAGIEVERLRRIEVAAQKVVDMHAALGKITPGPFDDLRGALHQQDRGSGK